MDALLQKLSAWKPFTVVVVGDFMLDQLVYGDAERLSADAPVPVLHVRNREDRAGGAANLCLDLVALKGRVVACGVVGNDEEGVRLRAALAGGGVDSSGLVDDAARPTTVKRSLIGLAQARHPQKMFRLDVESREAISDDATSAMLSAFERALADADAVCIEDYGKGVCTELVCQAVISAAEAAGKPVFVDPASGVDYGRYRGATAITPNRTEAETATGLRTHGDADAAHNAELAHALLSALDLEAVVLTLDRHGALLLRHGDHAGTAIPTVARQVYDVTGAGDMMLAALAAARVNGLEWDDAVRFANAAAGLEVEVFGVEPIPFERVHFEILSRATDAGVGALRPLDQLLVELAAVRSVGKRVVFTNGCFDVLHAGHVSLLEAARAHGDYLVVGLNSDESVSRLKGPERPVNGLEDRARLLGALRAVDAVVAFGADTPIELIEAIKPEVLVKGADYSKDQVVGREVVEAAGGRVELVDLVAGRSTTRIIEKVRGG